MPLNSHSYLVAQGWQGTGKALREGAASRPVIIAQRRNLAGVGRDRDEAFPFWDHVFTTMAFSINVRLSNDDSDEDTDRLQPSGSSTPLDRTSTGILSSRPQKVGLPVLDAPATPQSARPNIVALAKRESARRGLYSRFFRGPVLGPDTEVEKLLALEATTRPSTSQAEFNQLECNISTTEKKGKKRKFREEGRGPGVTQIRRKPKREGETKNERKEGRRLKRLREEARGEVYQIWVEGDAQTELTKISAEGPVRDGDGTGYAREKHHKRRKRKEESVVHHKV